MIDTAGQIKSLVTARQAAEYYGFAPNRSGFICCPLHKEKTASLKLFQDGGWKCFGCNAGGSVIDFVMQLFDLSFSQALVRIDSDFRLGLTGHKVDRREYSRILEKRRREKEEQEALEERLHQAIEEHRYWWDVLKYFSPSLEDIETGYVHPLYMEAIRIQPRMDGLIDELSDKIWERKKG